jgi:hypothetical protein
VGAGRKLSAASFPTYRPILVIPSPKLTLWLDEVAVANPGAATDLALGEARAPDGKLIVGCAAGSVLWLKRARVVVNAGLPSQWPRAVDNLGRGFVRAGKRRLRRPALADMAAAAVPGE